MSSVSTTSVGPPRGSQTRRGGWWTASPLRTPAWLLVPGIAFLALVFVYPMVRIAIRSVTEPSAANYTQLLETSSTVEVLWTTMEVSLIVTAFCLVVGYPYAYLLSRVTSRRWRIIMLVAIVLPFWTSWLVRTFAWMAILRTKGVVNNLLTGTGVIGEPLSLMGNKLGITIGMSYMLLPFMVLPLYAAMVRVDWSLVRAARSLGANERQAFTRVFLPLSMPGVVAGSALVFLVCVGFYITPELLGSPSNMMFGQLIATRISRDLMFGPGSALSVVLLVVVGIFLVCASRLVPVTRIVGGLERRP